MRRIAIAGGGTAGWMAAAALAKTLGDFAQIVLIESDAIGTIGVGESTIPPIVTFNRLLGIKEADFMAATQATFKLGIAFEGWKDIGERYFHSFGTAGKDHWTCGFQHFWLEGLTRGHNFPYDDYCMEVRAADARKFAHLPDDGLNYSYHLDSTLYARFLRSMAEEQGVKRIEGRIAEVALDPERGDITALVLDSGERVQADLFLDCTGFRALLIEGALHAGYDDWTHYLPCDRAIAVQTASTEAPLPYTRAIAHDTGWRWRIPLQHRTGNGIVYCSRYLDDEAAAARLFAAIEGEVLTQPNALRFQAGMRRRQWVRNCIAIGLSGGFLEPLESTSIHLIQRAVLRLMRMLPLGQVSERDRAEFNEQSELDFRQIRDFLILHYKAVNRRDSGFWRHCADMPIPDSLAHRIELFRETGRVFRKSDELFAENSWIQVMMGQGVVPQSYHPIAGKLRDDELDQFLAHLREQVARTVAGLPRHEDYIAHYCPARPVTGTV